ncbi:hypothetical protein BGX27_004811 [Mortierella sp. AM989]|nr:hypothetical protein BGX27_004811 [Mortierella sp. AM989]
MTRQEPEGEGKVPRSYSLASAPLRLLSHSFHSTANTHSPSSGSSSIASSPAVSHHLSLDRPYSDLLQKESSNSDSHLLHHDTDHVYDVSDELMGLEPTNTPVSLDKQHQHQCVPVMDSAPPSPKHCDAEQLVSAQMHHSLKHHLNTSDSSMLQSSVTSYEYDYNSHIKPFRKATRLISEEDVVQKHVDTQRQQTEIGSNLEMLLLPYDIRYSIFGRLSLQDIYNCQMTSKLLYWATSDQLIWKRIALNLIQGEFYFDIPRTLPTNIPTWKSFCKRHLLRQRNWRQGLVQDVISLDDNYQKLTTLQIMAPYVLTGCDDGRIHLWNINSRKLLHRFQIHGEITWVEHLQDQKIVAGLGYDLEMMTSEIRLFSTESGEQIGFYKEAFWDLAICAINGTYLVASDGKGQYTAWDWKAGVKSNNKSGNSKRDSLYNLDRPISQEEWDAQGAEVYWRHQLEHTCNFAAMGGGRFQLLYVQIFENLMDQVPIRVHSLKPNVRKNNASIVNADIDHDVDPASDEAIVDGNEGYGWQHGEYVTAHSLNPDLERIIQGLRPSRVDCDPEYIVVGLVQGGVRLLQFAPVDEDLFEQNMTPYP